MTTMTEARYQVAPVEEDRIAQAMRLITSVLERGYRHGLVTDFEGEWRSLDDRLRLVVAGAPFAVMMLRRDLRPVGISLVSFDKTEPEDTGCWEIFYALGAPGHATRQLARMTLEAAREKGLRRVTAYVRTDNDLAVRAASLAGFRSHEIEYRGDVRRMLRRLKGS